MISEQPDAPSTAVYLWELLIAFDAARADVWDDGSPYHAGIREGLDRAAALVRDALARIVQGEPRR